MAYFTFGFATTIWHAILFFLIYGVHYAITEPAEKTLVTHLTGATTRGRAFGWFSFVIGIATLPASILFGFLYDNFGPPAAFCFGGAMATLAILLLAIVRSKSSNPSKSTSAID